MSRMYCTELGSAPGPVHVVLFIMINLAKTDSKSAKEIFWGKSQMCVQWHTWCVISSTAVFLQVSRIYCRFWKESLMQVEVFP